MSDPSTARRLPRLKGVNVMDGRRALVDELEKATRNRNIAGNVAVASLLELGLGEVPEDPAPPAPLVHGCVVPRAVSYASSVAVQEMIRRLGG